MISSLRRVSSTLFVATLCLSGVACDNDPTKGKEVAQAAAPVEQATQAPADASTLVVSALDGKIGFVGAKVTAKHAGAFEKFKGRILLPPGDALTAENVAQARVELEVEVASLQVEPAKLRSHLLSGDFFEAEKFPTATFVSTSIQPKPPGGYEVTGNLELHGVKKSISFPAQIDLTGGTLKVHAEFGINRKDFAIVYPGMPDDLIKDEVLIQIDLSKQR